MTDDKLYASAEGRGYAAFFGGMISEEYDQANSQGTHPIELVLTHKWSRA